MQYQPEMWQEQPALARHLLPAGPWVLGMLRVPGDGEAVQGDGNKTEKKNLVLKICLENSVFVKRKKEHKKHVHL